MGQVAGLRGLDFTFTLRDPMYKRFAEAMADRERAEGLQIPVHVPIKANGRPRLAATSNDSFNT